MRVRGLKVCRFGAVYFVALCLVGGVAHAKSPCLSDDNIIKTDGACWNSLSPPEKGSVVRGIWTGMDTNGISRSLNGDDRMVSLSLDHAAIPPETTTGDIMAYFDKLYSTPANRKIDWSYAYMLAALNARDDDENDRLALVSFLREHSGLPTVGTITAIKGPDTLVIQSGAETFEVALAGITIPAEAADRAEAILRALAIGSYNVGTPCAKPEPTYVTLAYLDEIFDANKRLVATVRIGSLQGACIGSRFVDFHQANARFTPINYFLVRNGLALPREITDQLWTQERKSLHEGLELAKGVAEAQGLYIHGNATTTTIEQLLTPAN